MKVLHICNWYPTKAFPHKALWIKRHIQALSSHCENLVYHVEILKGKFSVVWNQKNEDGSKSFVLSLPFQVWKLNEWLSFFMVLVILRKEKSQVNLVNFHISYPLCTYLSRLKKRIQGKVVITEHWSAFHFHFGIKGSPKLNKIKQLFAHADQVIVVSKALKKDIEDFTQNHSIPFTVVPNVVESTTFTYAPALTEKKKSPTFFMVSNWKLPKDPFAVMEAFETVSAQHPDLKLRIGGYGHQEEEITNYIHERGLSDKISFIGRLSSEEIAHEMRQATGFIHWSHYETFSVVCAEAISCGCPVIASNVGGIKEFIHEKNGVLVSSKEEIGPAMTQLLNQKLDFNRPQIAAEAKAAFSMEAVGKQYFNSLK